MDSENVFEQCCKYDFEGWKMKNFVKDPGDQSDVKMIIKENYGFLKDVWTTVALNSNNWPNISQLDFSKFIEECNIPDKHTTLGIIDT